MSKEATVLKYYLEPGASAYSFDFSARTLVISMCKCQHFCSESGLLAS